MQAAGRQLWVGRGASPLEAEDGYHLECSSPGVSVSKAWLLLGHGEESGNSGMSGHLKVVRTCEDHSQALGKGWQGWAVAELDREGRNMDPPTFPRPWGLLLLLGRGPS